MSVRLRQRAIVVCCLLVGLALALGIVLLGTGTLSFSPDQVLGSLFRTGQDATADRIILGLRLPRLATGILVGASLGMAGSIFQSISRNALGSPDIIGFTTGAATGAIVQIILFNAGPLETSIAAVVAGLATAVLVYLLSMRGGASSGYRLVLVGIGVGAILSGFNTMLLVMGNLDQAMSAHVWLAGSLTARTWAHAVPAGVGFLLALPLALWHARRINLLEMGDDAARQLGVPIERTRLTMVMAAVALTAIATAAAGPIAFIALAAPQLARRLTGSPQAPLVSGAAMGIVLLLAADLLSQRLPLNANIPIGLTTGLLGGMYLLWLLSHDRKI